MNSDGKASPGGDFVPPRAELWNNMIDAGNAWRNGRLNSPAPQPTRARGTDLLKLKNSSAANRRKGEILKIDGKVIETITDEHIWLDGAEPTDDCRFGILKYPADNNEVQTCQVSGVCLALVNVTDADHQFAVAVEGEYVLQSAFAGPIELLFVPDLPAEEEYPFELECVVRFAANEMARVVIIGGLTAPANSAAAPTTCVCGMLRRNVTTNVLTTTDDRITALNWTSANTAADGTYAIAKFIGVWEIIWVDCNPTAAWEGLDEVP